MALITDTINPGDVISSALMRQLIERVNAHETALGGATPGGNVVPNLFGQTLASAQVALQFQNLVFGTVVDTGGALVSPSAPTSAQRMVLIQMPAAGSSLAAGRSVDIVVAGNGSGTTPPPSAPPAISLLVPASVRSGDTLEVQGTNLGGTLATVSFGGIAGTVLGTSNPTRLFVTVPDGIPGAPTAPGGGSVPNIAVRVANASGQAANTTITIMAPLASPVTITSFAPTIAVVGQVLTINGSGFSTTPAQNRVAFGSVNATASAATAGQLSVTVPTGIPGLVAPGDLTMVNVTVTRTSDNVVSGARPLNVTL